MSITHNPLHNLNLEGNVCIDKSYDEMSFEVLSEIVQKCGNPLNRGSNMKKIEELAKRVNTGESELILYIRSIHTYSIIEFLAHRSDIL